MNKLAFLLLIPMVFACSSYNSWDLENQSISISPTQCIYLNDLNLTIQAPSVQQNQSYNMSVGNQRTDAISNNVYSCQPDQLYINQTLSAGNSYWNPSRDIYIKCQDKVMINTVQNLTCGQSYYEPTYNISIGTMPYKANINTSLALSGTFTDTNANITVRAPAYPKLNAIGTLSYGQCYNNSDANISQCAVAYPKLNLKNNLSFGQCYNNSDLNISDCAPAYPKINNYVSLDFGQQYIESNTNITVLSSVFPKINETINLTCGQTKSYDQYNLVINAPKCPNVDKTLSCGETYKNDNFGISIKAPPKINQNIVISDNKTYSNADYGINVTCKAIMEDKIAWCSQLENISAPKIWQELNLTDNYQCSNMKWICVDNMTEYCTLEEKASGLLSLMQCYNRNIIAMNTNVKDATDKKNICDEKLDTCNQNSNNARITSDNIVIAIEWLGVGIGVIFAGKYFLDAMHDRRKRSAE